MTTARDLRSSGVLADPRELVRALGLEQGAVRQARGVVIRCPAHDDRSPSCSVRIAGDGTVAVRCHACNFTGDALHLVAIAHGLDARRDHVRVLELAAELAGRPAPARRDERREPRDENAVDDETYHTIWTHVLERCALGRARRVAAYLDDRAVYADAEAVGVRGYPDDSRNLVHGLLAVHDRKALEQCGVLRSGHDAFPGAKVNGTWREGVEWCVVIPWRNRYGRIDFVQRRRLDSDKPKYLSPSGRSPRAPFGIELLAEALPNLDRWLATQGTTDLAEVIVTEGALDCLARRALARRRGELAAVIGVYSAGSPDAGLPLDLLTGRRVVLALDNDPSGDKAAVKLHSILAPVARELVRERFTP